MLAALIELESIRGSALTMPVPRRKKVSNYTAQQHATRRAKKIIQELLHLTEPPIPSTV